MKITKNLVPSIAYQVRTQDGVLVDEAPVEQPLEYLHGHNNLVVGLENALEGKAVGDAFEVRVKPEEGYGEYNDNMVQRVPKDVFMGVDELEVGMRFIADTDIGPLPVVITEVDGDEVVVDGNHMLAGQELLFSVEVVAIREATLEEIAHGHIHGEHGGCCGGHDEDGCGCGGHHHHHHHDGCGCGGHHHEEAHEGCCDEHHHHHHNGVCCDEPHHHHHSANEECCQTAGECCDEHHHHHHNGVCCDEPHHHHHSANEECCQTAGECCDEHHHHHHNGVCCDEHHHHHHSADEKCNKQ